MSQENGLEYLELSHKYQLRSILQDETLPADDHHAPDLTNAVFFPWHKQSLQTLWDRKRVTTWVGPAYQDPSKFQPGTLPHERDLLGAEHVWLKVIQRWMGCAAICAGDEAASARADSRPYFGASPDFEDSSGRFSRQIVNTGLIGLTQDDICTVTWALDFDTLHPLVVFAGRQAIIYIVDVETWERVGAVTGHGGPITHVTTHPIRPNYILSTSQDWTARMWSLADPVDTPAAPAYWPGQIITVRNPRSKQVADELDLEGMSLQVDEDIPIHALQSRTGPAGGVSDRRSGGHGKGVCVAVFKGPGVGLGGHQSWVLCADFHPTKPFMVTGGADRAIKIWKVPDFPTPDIQPNVGVKFTTVELPVFSSTHLHEGGVDYVRWVTRDMIISKSRFVTTEKNDINATTLLWRWLDLDHFVSQDAGDVVRPGFQDYTESRSYMKVSDMVVQRESDDSEWQLDVCPSWPDLVLAAGTDTVHIIDLCEHLCAPHILENRERKLGTKYMRNARIRSLFHPVDLTEVPHQMVRMRGRDPSVDFQILRAARNPLNPRVLLGMGVNGILALWYENDDQ